MTNQAKARRFTHHLAENQTVRIPLRQEPNGLRTITSRTKRLAYHRTEPNGWRTIVQNHPFCDMLYRNWHWVWELRGQCWKPNKLGLKEKEQSQNNKTNTNAVVKHQNQKYGNVLMTQTPLSVLNQGLITQDWKVHKPVVKIQQGNENYSAI